MNPPLALPFWLRPPVASQVPAESWRPRSAELSKAGIMKPHDRKAGPEASRSYKWGKHGKAHVLQQVAWFRMSLG